MSRESDKHTLQPLIRCEPFSGAFEYQRTLHCALIKILGQIDGFDATTVAFKCLGVAPATRSIASS